MDAMDRDSLKFLKQWMTEEMVEINNGKTWKIQ